MYGLLLFGVVWSHARNSVFRKREQAGSEELNRRTVRTTTLHSSLKLKLPLFLRCNWPSGMKGSSLEKLFGDKLLDPARGGQTHHGEVGHGKIADDVRGLNLAVRDFATRNAPFALIAQHLTERNARLSSKLQCTYT